MEAVARVPTVLRVSVRRREGRFRRILSQHKHAPLEDREEARHLLHAIEIHRAIVRVACVTFREQPINLWRPTIKKKRKGKGCLLIDVAPSMLGVLGIDRSIGIGIGIKVSITSIVNSCRKSNSNYSWGYWTAWSHSNRYSPA